MGRGLTSLVNSRQFQMNGSRRFAVLPLTEDCGIVEWVEHTTGLRHVCQDTYVALGLFDKRQTNPAIKKMYDAHPVCPGQGLFKSKVKYVYPESSVSELQYSITRWTESNSIADKELKLRTTTGERQERNTENGKNSK